MLVELIDERPMPEGRSQIGHAQAIVRERFAEASILFAVDQLIKGTLRAVTGLIRGVFNALADPGHAPADQHSLRALPARRGGFYRRGDPRL